MSSTPLQDITLFISYNHLDREIALRIRNILKRYGARVWIDIASMSVGARIQESIETALNSSDAIVIIITRYSLSSFWVPFELGFALGHKKQVFPVIDGVKQSEIPNIISSLNCCKTSRIKSHLIPSISGLQIPPAPSDVTLADIADVKYQLELWKQQPELKEILFDTLSSDKNRRRIGHIRIHRMNPNIREGYLDIYEALTRNKSEHIRGESYYCIGQIPGHNGRLRHDITFFEKGLFDPSNKVKSCCTNIMRNYVPLSDTVVDRLEYFIALGMEDDHLDSNRSGMVYWAYIALDANRSASPDT